MFGALGRWIKAILYLLTGRIDSARQALDRDPNVIRAKFENIANNLGRQINQFMEAMAQVVDGNERRKMEQERLQGEIKKKSLVKAGAAEAGKQRVVKLRQSKTDITDAEMQTDPDYLRCMSAYNDATSSLEEMNKSLEHVNADIVTDNKRISELRIQLEGLKRQLDGIKRESADTVATVISSNQEKRLNAMLSGLAQNDSISSELQGLRAMKSQLQAEAKVSQIAAGTEAAASEREFMAYASSQVHSDEFAQAVGLSKAPKEESAEASKVPAGRLPE